MIILLFLYFTQEKLIFVGAYSNTTILQQEQDLNNNLVHQELMTKDNIKLNGAIIKNNNNNTLMIYFGGNASNSIDFLNIFSKHYSQHNIVSFNYRGFADSKGEASQKNLYSDAIEIYQKYKSKYKHIIVIGRSLGTAMATYLSSKVDIHSMILITPFDSILNISQKQYPFIPMKYLLKHPFNSVTNMKNNQTNCSIIIAKEDTIVSNINTNSLKKEIINLTNFIVIDDVTHDNIIFNKDVLKFINNNSL